MKRVIGRAKREIRPVRRRVRTRGRFMDTQSYYASISEELGALKNRVRMMINDAHWPTDGEWKESVLRAILRRTAPESVTVGRGFVVDRDACSTQIDVLVYDNTMPILYRDSDLVFVPPIACRAIVEVKSSLKAAGFLKAAKKLATVASSVRKSVGKGSLFVGLFAYDFDGKIERSLLEDLLLASAGTKGGIINHVALGVDGFVKFWDENPAVDGGASASYQSWHLYSLPRLAPGYFIHNLLTDVSSSVGRSGDIFFPRDGKERGRIDSLGLKERPAPAPARRRKGPRMYPKPRTRVARAGGP
jgi:Domain of unknown function (DUF6602)